MTDQLAHSSVSDQLAHCSVSDQLAHSSVSDQDLVDSLVWISLTSQPLKWLSIEGRVQDMDDLLIPEFPLTYLWWEACYRLNQLMAPMVPIETNKVPLSQHAASYARDSATLNLAAVQVYDKDRSWDELFVHTTMQMIREMRRLVAQPKKSPLLKYYESRGVQWDKLIDRLDFFFYMTHLPKRDILFTAASIAGEYIANDLGKNAIPSSILRRLELTTDFYTTVPDEAFEAALILPKPGLMSHSLIPVVLYESRAKRERQESMTQFSLVCAAPASVAQEPSWSAHASSLAQILVREGTKPLPTTLDEFCARSLSLCQLATLVLRPTGLRASVNKDLCHDCARESHIFLLPSLKETLAKLDRSTAALTLFQRVEYNQTLKRAAVQVYIALPLGADQCTQALGTLKEQPWHDRWAPFHDAPWTKQSVHWIEDKPEIDRGLNLATPLTIMSISPWMRLAWWIEDKMRTMLAVEASDISAEFNPLINCACVSLYVPKEIEINPTFVQDLLQLAPADE